MMTCPASFALFLCLVIKRLVGLISANAGLQVSRGRGRGRGRKKTKRRSKSRGRNRRGRLR